MKPYLARTLSILGILALYFPHAAFAQDADSDFLSDAEELAVGSDPYNKDTDGDDILDREELYPFQIVAGTFTYEAALDDAKSKGGRLVVIDSLDKLYKVKRGLLTTSLPSPLPNNYDPAVTLANALWIGAQDIGKDGQYQWADFGSTLANPINLSELGSAVFGDLTPGSSTVSNVVNIAALTVGRPFVASGVPTGTTITAINSVARTLTLSNPVDSILSQRISRVVVSNGGANYSSSPLVSFTGGAPGVSSVAVTTPGSGYTSAPTVTLTGGGGSGVSAVAAINGLGEVSGITITSRGSGYTTAPTVALAGGFGLTAVNVTAGGSGYTSAPTVTFTGGLGLKSMNVTATGSGYVSAPDVVVTGGVGLSSLSVTNAGLGYASAPAVTLTGGIGLSSVGLTTGGSGYTAAPAVTFTGGIGLTVINVTVGGSGYTTAPTVTFAGGGGSGATATALVSGGKVVGISITNPGTGYTSAPTLSFTGGGGTLAAATAAIGTPATAVSTVSGGVVTGISITNPGTGYASAPTISLATGIGLKTASLTAVGTGYTSAPTVAITGGGGTGAEATVTINANGSVNSITITNAGSNYTSAPTLSFSGGGGTGAAASVTIGTAATATATIGSGGTATAIVSGGVLTGFSITSLGSGYVSSPTVNLTGGTPLIPAVASASIGTPATATALLTGGQVTGINMSNAGSNYTSVPTINLVGGGSTAPAAAAATLGTGATATASFSGGLVTGVTLTSPGTNYTGTPLVTLTGGAGTGATAVATFLAGTAATATASLGSEPTAVATLFDGKIQSITVTSDGSKYYTSAPTVAISGGNGAGAAAASTLTLAPASAGGLASVQLNLAGSGYASAPAVTFTGGGGTGATGTASIDGSGKVTGITISSPGTGYTSAPTVVISGGASATATSIFAGGQVTGINISNAGSNYTSAPTVTFTGGGGTGLAGTASIDGSGKVTGITISSPGTGYTSAPTVVISGDAAATATLIPSTGSLASVQLNLAGSGYTSAPAVTFTGGGGTGATGTASIDGSGKVTGIAIINPGTGYSSPPTVSIAGGSLTAINVTNPGINYTSAPTVSFINGGGTGAAATAVISEGLVTGITITSAGTGYSTAPTITLTGGGAFVTATATATVNTGATATASIRQLAARVSSPVPGAYVNWLSDLLPGNRTTQEGVFLSAGSVFTWNTDEITTTRGYLLERRPTSPTKSDTDGDGVSDGIEINPAVGGFTSNPLVQDTDGDGLDDARELTFLSNPNQVDTDGDGLTDLQESNYGNDPLVADVAKDTDGDGLTNQFEVVTSLTNPTIADTDGDGVSDGIEINGVGGFTSNPLVQDTDSDGASDSQELNAVPPTNPRDPASKPAVIPPEDLYKFSQFKNEVSITIPVPYTPFGNRMEFNRYGDDGSKCVLDASGVLTWIDSQGVVRLLPDSAEATPLFVTNSECLVWSNRFVDFNSYPARPVARLVMFRAVAGSATFTSSPVTFQGKEIVDTAPTTTTTGTLTFISTARKDNGRETEGPPVQNNSDDADIRFYRVTFDAGVQFVKALSIPVRSVPDFAAGVTGPDVKALAYGSDGSMAVKIPDVQTNPKQTSPNYETQYHWFDNQGRSVRLLKALGVSESVSKVLFCSNTRLVYADTAGVIKEQRRSFTSGELIGLPTTIALSTTTEEALDLGNYARVGDQKFIYTLDANKKTVRTYLLGSTAALRSTAVLTDAITTSAVTGTVNPRDGSALIYDEDSSKLIWLHNRAPGFETIGTGESRPLFVTNEQAVIWENATAQAGGGGTLPAAVVAHYTGVDIPSTLIDERRTVVTTVGTNLLNTSRITPDFASWLFTTSQKTAADTARLRTYLLVTAKDTDNDGLADNVETNTGIFISRTDTGSDPSDPDTDGDGVKDGNEVYPYSIVNGTFTWAQAKANALVQGGKLASLSDKSEADAVKAKFSDQSFSSLWLGGSDSVKEGTWVWESGAPWTYTNWTAGQPDNLDNADGLVLQNNDEWSDSPVSETRGYLLEKYPSNPNQSDTDGDGLNDGDELTFKTNPILVDTDGDGLNDGPEVNTHDSDPTKTDTDGDGLSDGVEVNVHQTDPAKVDTDGDGISDSDEIADATNPTAKDSDGDGLEDGAEKTLGTNPLVADTDGDRLSDGDEVNKHTSNPLVKDTDTDGIEDGDEVAATPAAYYSPYGPTSPTKADTDGDGLTDKQELQAVHKTDPNNRDTDGDGVTDGDETTGGTNPTMADTDGDGLKDNVETNTGIYVSATNTGTSPVKTDTDADGLSDGQEVNGVPPFGPTDPLKQDTDGDGLKDGAEISGNGIGKPSNPTLIDTDGDGISDFAEINASPPTNPNDPLVNHTVPVAENDAATISIASSFAPFGARPDTDKIGDDGSAVVRDRNGVLIWSSSSNDSDLIPNSSLARTLYVSNTECVVYQNRYATDYNTWGSTSSLIIYRREADGTVAASSTIPLPGTVLDTSPVTPNSFGFTLIGASGFADGTESRQRYQSGTNAAGFAIYDVRDVDKWDKIAYQMYRLTWDGKLQSLNSATVSVPKTGTNLGATNVIGGGDDGSFVFTNTVARDFYDDVVDSDPGAFKSGQAALWATWNINYENITGTVAVEARVGELAYCSNSRLLLENAILNPVTFIPTGNYEIVDRRMSQVGVVRTAITQPLAAGDKTLPLSTYTRSGLPAYVYTIDILTGKQLKLFRFDATLDALGAAVALPSVLTAGNNFVRNPRDASLLIKSEGPQGILWIPSIGYSPAVENFAATPVTGLGAPKSLPNSTLGLPMFVTSTEAVAWMNSGASVDLGLGGKLPLAQILHFTPSLTSSILAPPIEGRYVALPSPLTQDAESEGWFVTTFEKSSDRSAFVRNYRLYTERSADEDRDGLTGAEELALVPPTEPRNWDSDGDGVSDGDEVRPFKLVTDTPRTWELARAQAQSSGGRLVVLDTQAKQDAFRKKMGNSIERSGVSYWVGGEDFSKEGDYRWLKPNGDLAGSLIVPPTNWDSAQPVGGSNSNGMEVRPVAALKWAMALNTKRQGYVFEGKASSPTKADTDGDFLNDGQEIAFGSDPTNPDTDGDELDDKAEYDNKTNPLKPDTDGDGLLDLAEINGNGTGKPSDPTMLDTDGDLFNDNVEIAAGSDPMDRSSRPPGSPYVDLGNKGHFNVRVEREPADVSIPAPFSPFGNRTDFNRYGDDGSAILADVSGLLIWQGLLGELRPIPGSELAAPLIVSGSEAIVWTNAFADYENYKERAAASVAIYRVNPVTGLIGAPTPVTLQGKEIVATAPITTTSEGYTVVTSEHGLGGNFNNTLFRIYRITFSGQVQRVGQFDVNGTGPADTAGAWTRAIGHGSDGSIVFSQDGFDANQAGGVWPAVSTDRFRRIFWVDGTRFGTSGIWEELASTTASANWEEATEVSRVVSTSRSRVIYEKYVAGEPRLIEARRNSFTGFLVNDGIKLATPVGFSRLLQSSTQTVEGQTRWFHVISVTGDSIQTYRVTNNGVVLVYTSSLPPGVTLDETATVEKINHKDGSAVIISDNVDALLWTQNNGSDPLKNLVTIPNSRQAKAIIVEQNELLLWTNAKAPIDGSGRLPAAEVTYYQQAEGKSTVGKNLSYRIEGNYILTTPPFTPDYDYWLFSTVEKTGTSTARLRTYRLLDNAHADDDGDRLVNAQEALPLVTAPYPVATDFEDPDSDDDGISDGLELQPFRIIPGNFTLEEARQDAVKRGGRLATPQTSEKQARLEQQLAGLNLGTYLWIGGGDMEGPADVAGSCEGKFGWVNASGSFFDGNTSVSVPFGPYLNWEVGQPTNISDADGVQLDPNFTWSTSKVNQRQGYVLETAATNPTLADTDSDGLKDGEEFAAGTDPSKADTDGDGLSDGAEVSGVGGYTSDPLLVDTDGDGVSDFDESKAVPPTDPRNTSRLPGAKHNRPVTYQSPQTVTLPSSFSPFGQRPDTDKIGDDGSLAMRDRNGALIWSDRSGKAVLIPNSSQAKTLYVSNTECVVYNNRYAADYNIWDSVSNIIIYRRATDGTVTASPPIVVRGSVLDTSPVTPNSYGFTIIAAYGWNFSTTDSKQRIQTGSNAQGPTYTVNTVDQWHDINYQQYRITWDAALQSLNFTTVSVPKTNTNLGGTRILGYGDDGSVAFVNDFVALDFSDDAEDADPGVFKTGQTTLWATWKINGETIVNTPASDGKVREVAYVSNSRLLLEGAVVDTTTGFETGNYEISDYRIRLDGVVELAGTSPLAAGYSLLPVATYSRTDLPAYVYTVNATGTQLQLGRYDDTLVTLGGAVPLPAKVSSGSSFVRNPRDASLLIKSQGSAGILWIPTNGYSSTTPVRNLNTPRSLPSSALSLPMFVSAEEAVAWMNGSASGNLGAGGVLPLAQISHFTSSAGGIVTKTLTPPIVGRYVALPSPLTPDPDLEGWFVTTFEKTSDRAALIRSYQLLEEDTDGDGLSDRLEISYGTNPLVMDTDGDGLKDGLEVTNGTDPLDGDTDNDGLLDGEEVALGTDPKVGDTDSDGRLDGAEVDAGTDPLKFDEPDTDGDGVSDKDESNILRTDPLTPSFGPGAGTEAIPFSNSLVSGDYSGLVFDPKSGHSFKQNLRLSAKGSFSSSLLGLVGDSSFKGTFSTKGAFTGIPNPTSGLISVQMNLVKQGANKYYIEGNFKTRTGGTLYFQLRHTLYSKSNAYSSAGKVTFEAALPSSVSGPSGSAVATGSISTSGQVAFKIYLPDGSSSSYSAPIVDGDLIPLFSRSSSKARTVLIGTLKLEDLKGQSDFAGSVRLFGAPGASGSLFPSGFDQLRKLTGSRYYLPAKGTLPLSSFVPTTNNAVFNWLGGNFDRVQKVGTWATNGKMTVPATQNDSTKASFSSSTGLLTLTHTRTDTTRSLVKAPAMGYAVVVQKNSTFNGYYTSGLSAGDFEVAANTSGLNPEITSVSPLNKSVSAAATSYTVTVGTAGTWSVVIPSSVNWISATVSSVGGATGSSFTTPGSGNGTVVITVALNVTNARREAEITIAGIKHTIKQEFR